MQGKTHSTFVILQYSMSFTVITHNVQVPAVTEKCAVQARTAAVNLQYRQAGTQDILPQTFFGHNCFRASTFPPRLCWFIVTSHIK